MRHSKTFLATAAALLFSISASADIFDFLGLAGNVATFLVVGKYGRISGGAASSSTANSPRREDPEEARIRAERPVVRAVADGIEAATTKLFAQSDLDIDKIIAFGAWVREQRVLLKHWSFTPNPVIQFYTQALPFARTQTESFKILGMDEAYRLPKDSDELDIIFYDQHLWNLPVEPELLAAVVTQLRNDSKAYVKAILALHEFRSFGTKQAFLDFAKYTQWHRMKALWEISAQMREIFHALLPKFLESHPSLEELKQLASQTNQESELKTLIERVLQKSASASNLISLFGAPDNAHIWIWNQTLKHGEKIVDNDLVKTKILPGIIARLQQVGITNRELSILLDAKLFGEKMQLELIQGLSLTKTDLKELLESSPKASKRRELMWEERIRRASPVVRCALRMQHYFGP